MLTTLETLKLRLRLSESDVVDDDFLTSLIAGVSARMENECNRKFGYATGQTEEVQGDETEIRVARAPIVSVTSFSLKANETTGWEVQADVDYLVRRAFVISLSGPLGTWQQQLKVTYTGGYILPDMEAVTGVETLPEDVKLAATEQCAYLFQNKDRLGLSSISGDGGSLSMAGQSVVKPFDLIPLALNVCQKYERWLN